jgi:hypothetical protein
MRYILVVSAMLGLAVTVKAGVNVPAGYCMPQDADNGTAYRALGGFGNSSTSYVMYVDCPILFWADPPTADGVSITIGSTGATQDVYCQTAGYPQSGAGWWSSTKYLCATAGGCTTPTVAGANRTNTITWSYPLGTSALGVWNLEMECVLPANGGDALITYVY